jgi:hypothetical protein
MTTNKKRAFRMPHKEAWFGLMITLLGVTLMILAFEV